MLNDKKIEIEKVSSNCPQCGAQLEVNAQSEKVVCQYCGTQFVVKEDTKDIVKKGAVESFLNFVENQQKRIDDKKKRIDDEKKRAEEEAKREREKTIEFIKKHGKILLGALIALIIIVSFGIWSERNDLNDATKIAINSSSSEFKGKNYDYVVLQLQEAGFTNIKTEALDDLVTGWLTKDGEVEGVDINGITTFSENTSFLKDAKIIITYHTFPKKEESDTKSTGKESSGSSEKINQEIEETILNVNNNDEFAAILKVKDPTDPIVKEFAEKYVGRTIEFDGCVAMVINHEKYKTRYDFLICSGDYNTTPVVGAFFSFIDVNYYDLHLTGSKIPDRVGEKDNLHIKAKIGKYDIKGNFISLDPISIETR